MDVGLPLWRGAVDPILSPDSGASGYFLPQCVSDTLRWLECFIILTLLD